MSSSRNALRSRALSAVSTSCSSAAPQMTVPAYVYSIGSSTAVSADRSTSRKSDVAAYFAAADVAAPLAAAAAHILGSRILERCQRVAAGRDAGRHMGDAQRSDCHRAGQLCDLGARTACRQRRAQRRQKYDRKQQRRIARG